MLVVGLTGGIGSGKSTVAARFAARGVPIIDADDVAHQLVEPGRPALQTLVQNFGLDILDQKGGLNRPWLRRRVFADPALRRRLERLLHPLIREEMRLQLASIRSGYAILVIPLLVETGQADLVDRVLVVDTAEDLQYARCLARDGADREQVESILAAQAKREERLARADDVLVNDGSLEQLERSVEALHQRYSRLASHPR